MYVVLRGQLTFLHSSNLSEGLHIWIEKVCIFEKKDIFVLGVHYNYGEEKILNLYSENWLS